MNKIIKKIASFLILSLALTVLLFLGMGHWMSKEPMHHGNHECCDFVPTQGSTPPSPLLILPTIFAAIACVILAYRSTLKVKQVSFVPFLIQPHGRRLFRGIVQQE